MQDIIFLTTEDVLEIHRNQIELYGGSPELRDPGLLDSALHQPSAQMFGEFLHKDLAEMAAAYLFHIVKNHAFVDGNKRTGAVAAGAFLRFNGLIIIADPDTFEQLVLSTAEGNTTKVQLTEFFRTNTRILED